MIKPLSSTQKLRRRGKLNDRLARAIGERILSGEFPPGSSLPNEAEWGRIYGASRTAVREAIKALSAKGLVVSRQKVGSKVQPRVSWNLLDRDVLDWHLAAIDKMAFVLSTQEARHLLEPGIAGLAALKRTPAQLKKLAEAVDAMENSKTIAELNLADIAFHTAMLEAANNEFLVPFGMVIEKALATLFEFTAPRLTQREHVLKLHERVAHAIAAGDEKRAGEAMTLLLSDTDQIVRSRKR